MLWKLRARAGYWLARQLLGWRWWVAQPRAWHWMEGQYARMANLGDRQAQSFYGHLLLFRGQGLGAREEGLRLLGLAARAGDAKAAYQLGVSSLAGSTRQPPDGREAARWWTLAAENGHPLAAHRLAELYRQGGEGLPADPDLAGRYAGRAGELGL
ncbi:SEL1-like repeat protein [Pseudomonas kuykendallii]|uniref:Sel1 repeat-containing protein n=1 Tax=Pseudomonas kuykendallii TaxID=1007099 RepID=A0A1H3FXJ8_9PSED|nr:SEL1-like repeat protein [Pseudomonas kuykendallii]MCQ4272243.1 SEL1-like repeat protein [Pseudomonas kuykendallii]SDX95517.1 Sel1 repeat-containing protein [Pseudomonas kuykendallii]